MIKNIILFISLVLSNNVRSLDDKIQAFGKQNNMNAIYKVFQHDQNKNISILSEGIIHNNSLPEKMYLKNMEIPIFIGSLSKQILAYMILRIVYIEKKFALSDSLYNIFKKYNITLDPKFKNITLYDALTHQIEVSEYTTEYKFFLHKQFSYQTLSDLIYKKKHNSFQYSNTSYKFLSWLIKLHYDQDINATYHKIVLDPLNMINTKTVNKNNPINVPYGSTLVIDYRTKTLLYQLLKWFISEDHKITKQQYNNQYDQIEFNIDKMIDMYHYYFNEFEGDGGLISNMNDITNLLLDFYLHNKVIDKKIKDSMFTRQVLIDLNKKKFYGLGAIISEHNNNTILGHVGSIPSGLRIEPVYIPEKKLFIIIYSNIGYFQSYIHDNINHNMDIQSLRNYIIDNVD